MMASAQVVETSVNTNNSPSQDYTTNPDDHSHYNIDSPGLKPFTVINKVVVVLLLIVGVTKARRPQCAAECLEVFKSAGPSWGLFASRFDG